METTINQPSDVEALFSKADGIKTVYFRKNQQVFLQGDISRSIFYIVEGAIKLTVLSTRGKEALVAVLHEGEFFGESCGPGKQDLIGHVGQQTLAEMIGTTRQRVNYLLKYLDNWPL
jgi:Cyclic nucleotide-binding domain